MNKAANLVGVALLVILALGIGIEIGSATEDKPYYQCAKEGGPFIISIASCSTVWAMHHIEPIGIAITGLATIVVALFTGTLSRATLRLWQVSRESADLAEKQFLLAGRQTDLEEKVHGLTRLQHIATHRPKLRVRQVGVFLTPNHPIRVQYFVVNIGNTEATIIANDTEIHIERPNVAKIIDAKGIQEPRKIQAGQAVLFARDMDNLIYQGDWMLDETMDGRIRVNGFLKYEDIAGNVRETAFWRIYRAASNRFRPLSEPAADYERESED